jgi:Kelch motif protein/galactose oxidase-like protein
LLDNGMVLLSGGGSGSGCNNNSTEVYDPAAGSFNASALMSVGRAAHTATLLSGGKVLIAGGATCASPSVGELFDSGDVVSSAELFDPAAGALAQTGTMSTPRQSHTATLLPDGKVLITGGDDNSGLTLASAELYDPVSGTFTSTSMMHKPRIGHSATLLSNGKVLIAGGYAPCSPGCIDLPDNTAELYDPSTGTFTPTGSLLVPRGLHTATLLTGGLVLISGGDFCGLSGAGAGSECASEDGTNEAELYDPATGAFSATGQMAYARIAHSATLLSDGKVLIVGGFGADPVTQNDVTNFTAELFDPATGFFSQTGSMALARSGHTATLISNGRVLVAGGNGNDGSSLSSAEIYK